MSLFDLTNCMSRGKAQLTHLGSDRWLGLFFGDVAERFKALVSQTSGDSGKGCAPVGSNPIISAITAPQLR